MKYCKTGYLGYLRDSSKVSEVSIQCDHQIYQSTAFVLRKAGKRWSLENRESSKSTYSVKNAKETVLEEIVYGHEERKRSVFISLLNVLNLISSRRLEMSLYLRVFNNDIGISVDNYDVNISTSNDIDEKETLLSLYIHTFSDGVGVWRETSRETGSAAGSLGVASYANLRRIASAKLNPCHWQDLLLNGRFEENGCLIILLIVAARQRTG
ncbi:hypothetical protein V1478_008037 [Vespula squamosa]|uniref:Uncharacterized protein n=1 Tax=Vespula squamosa TaxID=30214 RepID=A0ABD2AXM1_VESSQ